MAIQEIVTPAYIREGLPHVQLSTFGGTAFSDAYIQRGIQMAVAHYERKYSIVLSGAVTSASTAEFDVRDWEAKTWYLKTVPKRPIADILSFTVQYANYPAYTLPTDWIKVASRIHGQVQIMPGTGSVQYPVLGGNSSGWFTGAMLSMYDYTPGLMHLKWRAGFERSLGQATVADGSSTMVLDAQSEVSDSLLYGSFVKLGPTLYTVSSVDGTNVYLQADAQVDHTATAYFYNYDPLIVEAVRLFASLDAVAAANDTRIKDPGTTSWSVAVDGISQSKAYNPRGPYANTMMNMRSQLEQVERSLDRAYREVSIFIE